MKRNLFLVIGLALAFVMTGCQDNASSRLKHEIEIANRNCPMDLGMAGSIKSLSYDEDALNVETLFIIKDNMISIDFLKNNENVSRQNMKLALAAPQFNELLKLIVDANASMTYAYQSPATGETYKTTMTHSDLKSILDNPISDQERRNMILNNQIILENRQFPQQIEAGMTMTQLFDDGDKLVYVIEMDEDLYDMSLLQEAVGEVKRNILDSNLFGDPTMKVIAENISSLGKGITLRYKGDQTGLTVDIPFSPNEISSQRY